jgi:hypothetical protein
VKTRVEKLWADFYNWPQSWKGLPEDVPFGEGIIEVFRPFVEALLARYSSSTVNRHLNNLWLLGGELIRAINMDPDDREKTPLDLILENVDETGGPYCRHLDSEEQMRAYEATCRKLSRFLRGRGAG